LAEIATLAGGCFWCTEAVFSELEGVQAIRSGYTGGKTENPTYEEVCTDLTGHAEAVQVTFDSKIISYEELLKVFFSTHDPTTLNRQGNDVGTQYRSAIFYHNQEQKQTAERVIKQLTSEKVWDRPIVTELVPFKTFYFAEDYHNEYFKRNPNQGYCRVVIAPKMAKFRKHYESKLKKTQT
jgi:peptide-methionine (S)-S-oxide reductase